MKTVILAAAALAIAAPAAPVLAQAAAMPMCSAKVKDGCQQTPAQERAAMTADQAEKSGGVGDRHLGSDPSMAAGGGMTMHHHMVKKHRAMAKASAG